MYEDYKDILPACPLCGGELTVEHKDLVYCTECEKFIGYYVANAGAVRLHPDVSDKIHEKYNID